MNPVISMGSPIPIERLPDILGQKINEHKNLIEKINEKIDEKNNEINLKLEKYHAVLENIENTIKPYRLPVLKSIHYIPRHVPSFSYTDDLKSIEKHIKTVSSIIANLKENIHIIIRYFENISKICHDNRIQLLEKFINETKNKYLLDPVGTLEKLAFILEETSFKVFLTDLDNKRKNILDQMYKYQQYFEKIDSQYVDKLQEILSELNRIDSNNFDITKICSSISLFSELQNNLRKDILNEYYYQFSEEVDNDIEVVMNFVEFIRDWYNNEPLEFEEFIEKYSEEEKIDSSKLYMSLQTLIGDADNFESLDDLKETIKFLLNSFYFIVTNYTDKNIDIIIETSEGSIKKFYEKTLQYLRKGG